MKKEAAVLSAAVPRSFNERAAMVPMSSAFTLSVRDHPAYPPDVLVVAVMEALKWAPLA